MDLKTGAAASLLMATALIGGTYIYTLSKSSSQQQSPPPSSPPPSSSSCTAQPCPCGQVWDSVLCQCSALIPQAVSVLENPEVDTTWLALSTPYSTCFSTSPSSSFSCPSFNLTGDRLPCTGYASYQFTLTGKVVDSAGRAICNQSVDISVSPVKSEWEVGTPPISWSGVFSVLAPSSVKTDSQGNFSVTCTISGALTSSANFTCIPDSPVYGCPPLTGGTEVVTPVTFTYTVQNTTISATSVVTIKEWICWAASFIGQPIVTV